MHKNVLNTWRYKVMDNNFYYTVIFWQSFIFFFFLHKMSQLLERLNIMDNKSFLFNVVFILVVFNFLGQFCFVVWGFVVCAQILFYFSAHKMSLLERFNIMHNNKFCLKYYHFCLNFFSFMHIKVTLSKRLLKCVSVCQWVILSIQICRHRFGWQSFTWACLRLKLAKQLETFTAVLTRDGYRNSVFNRSRG